jgi:CheY-like chemotaxis protein
MNPAPVILVAEDNDDDFVLLRCAFESAGFRYKLTGVADGVDAINYLYADEPFTNRSAYPFPDLMLLDLHMSAMDGIAVLAAVKNRFEFRSLPIVVLSSMDDPDTIHKALKLGAKDFLIKPLTMEDRIKMVKRLHSRWLKGTEKPAIGRRLFNPWAARLPVQASTKSW